MGGAAKAIPSRSVDREHVSARERNSFVVRAGGIAAQLVERIRRRPSARVQRTLLAVSLFAFVAMGVIALRNFPDVGERIRWSILIPVGVIGMSANLILNAVEFQVIGRVVDQRIRLLRAMRVTIIGSAANLLPLPGSTLVRVQALASDGARFRHAITGSVTIGVMSVGATLVLVSVANVREASAGLVLALLLTGCLVILVAFAMLRTACDTARATRFGLYALGVEAAYATIASFRLWLIFIGLGIDVGLPAAFALSAAGSIATAIGFFPAGLGLQEALVGVLSPLVGIPAVAGLAGAVVSRLFSFIILAAASGFLLARGGERRFTEVGPDPNDVPASEKSRA